MIKVDSNIRKELLPYVPILQTLVMQFGRNCEAALHDLSKPHCSLVALCGSVTGRSIGAPITNYVLNLLKMKPEDIKNSYVYSSKTKSGQLMNSSTTFIRDDKNNIIGCICINYLIEEILTTINVLKEFSESKFITNENKDKTMNSEVFSNNINEVVHHILDEVLNNGSLVPENLNKAQKIEIIKELDNKGLFLVKGSVDIVARKLQVSKFSIYNYLEKIGAKLSNAEIRR